jgi:hypothetical protein
MCATVNHLRTDAPIDRHPGTPLAMTGPGTIEMTDWNREARWGQRGPAEPHVCAICGTEESGEALYFCPDEQLVVCRSCAYRLGGLDDTPRCPRCYRALQCRNLSGAALAEEPAASRARKESGG